MRVRVRGHYREGRPVRAHTRGVPRRAAGLGAAALLLILGGYAIDTGHVPNPLDHTLLKPAADSATVTRVVDGDTLDVRLEDGSTDRVRLLGLDAPEVRGNECGAASATDALRALTQGRTVSLVKDPNQPDRGPYNRLLRYVDVDDPDVDATQTMIRRGLAPATSRDDTHARHDTYAWAESRARADGAGIWGSC